MSPELMVGSVATLPMVWSFADIANGLMAIPNLISLLMLNGIIVSETKKYLWKDNLDAVEDSVLAQASVSQSGM